MSARAMIRRALRVARNKEGASERDIAPKFAEDLLAMGLIREVVLRVAISGAVIERRWKLTEKGHFWLDEDAETPIAPPVEEEAEAS